MRRPVIAAALSMAAALLAGGAPSAMAQAGPGWPEVKCARYKAAWTEALARRGTRGLGQDFLARHEAFLASGCTAKGDVCPRSSEELALANIMVISAMNAGTASTFPPFACGR